MDTTSHRRRPTGSGGAPWIGRPPRPPGVPWIWGLACLVLGWYAGVLFRMRQLTGVSIMDMFGFWCLVGAGLCAARFFALWQVADARQRILRALASLPDSMTLVAVPGARDRGRGGAEWVVIGPQGWWVLGVSDISAAARRRQADRHLGSAARRLVHQGETLRATLTAAGVSLPGEPCYVLVLSRRPQAGPVLEDGVLRMNPEHLPEAWEIALAEAAPEATGSAVTAAPGAGPSAADPEGVERLRSQLRRWWSSVQGGGTLMSGRTAG